MAAVALVATAVGAAASASFRFALFATLFTPIHCFYPTSHLHSIISSTKWSSASATQSPRRRLRRRVPLLPSRDDNISPLFSSADDDDDESYWDLEGDDDSTNSSSSDPRLTAMRSILESSWDVSTMGNVPTTPQQAATAAVNCISNAINQSNDNPHRDNTKQILMVDVRLPTYDITEGSQYYDPCAVYDLASFMAEEMQRKKLVNKCLILVRNENERVEIANNREMYQRPRMRRDDESTASRSTTAMHDEEEGEDSLWEIPEEENDNNSDEVDDFRKKLMSSWISTDSNNKVDDDDDGVNHVNANIISSEKQPPPQPSPSVGMKSIEDTPNLSASSSSSHSHRLWSMIGDEDVSNTSYSTSDDDTFHRIISAVDNNARLLDDEDAIILLSPYTTNDMIAIRRILARYCGSTTQKRTTVILVNSRLEVLPKEMDSAVLVYGILPLVARSKQQTNMDSGGEDAPGLKAVVMKRYPNDWSVYVDVYGDGFVEATTNDGTTTKPITNTGSYSLASAETQFPSPEWIAMKVQAHVQGLTRKGRD